MRRIVILTGFLFLSSLSFAQKKGYGEGYINYSIGIPASQGFKDFVSKTSFAGLNGGGLYYLSDRFAIGGSFGWNDFYQKDNYSTIELDSGAALTATYKKGIFFNPLLVNTRYIIMKNSAIRISGGFDFGLYFMKHRYEVSIYYDEESRTLFGISPNLGIAYMPDLQHWGIQLVGHYNVPFDGGKSEFIDDTKHWTIDIGFVWRTR